MKTLTLHIEGMTCGSCLRRVRQALERVPGARVLRIDRRTADVEIDDDNVTWEASVEALLRAVEDAGYPAALAEAA